MNSFIFFKDDEKILTVCYIKSGYLFIYHRKWNSIFLDEEAVTKCKETFILKKLSDIQYTLNVQTAYNSSELYLNIYEKNKIPEQSNILVWFSEEKALLKKIARVTNFYDKSVIIPINHDTNISVSFGKLTFILSYDNDFETNDFFL
jgi:DNA polymerase elongation subunit (family B)